MAPGGVLTVCCYTCCPFLGELLSPREVIALGLTILLALAALLLGLAGGQEAEVALLRWSNEDWRDAECWVQQVGIDYTGDCNLREKDEEGEPFNYGLWPPVKKSSAEAPQYDYSKCPKAHMSCSADAKSPELVLAPKSNQGINMPRYNLVACHNSFVPWAMVEVSSNSSNSTVQTESTFCGFQLGFRFQEESLLASQQIVKHLSDEGHVSCWVLDRQDCHAVALQAPKEWPINDSRSFKTGLFVSGLGVSLLAVVVFLLECCCTPEPEDAKETDQELPEELPLSISARIRRVQQRWSIFQATLLQQYEPLSARDVNGSGSARMGRLGAAP